jgi:hypothetical protein
VVVHVDKTKIPAYISNHFNINVVLFFKDVLLCVNICEHIAVENGAVYS